MAFPKTNVVTISPKGDRNGLATLLRVAAPIEAGRGRALVLEEGEDFVIGRSPMTDFPIHHGSVSGAHAKIFCLGDHFYLEDLDSTNGTYLNGEEVGCGQVVVRPGNLLQVGKVTIDVLAGDPGTLVQEALIQRLPLPIGVSLRRALSRDGALETLLALAELVDATLQWSLAIVVMQDIAEGFRTRDVRDALVEIYGTANTALGAWYEGVVCVNRELRSGEVSETLHTLLRSIGRNDKPTKPSPDFGVLVDFIAARNRLVHGREAPTEAQAGSVVNSWVPALIGALEKLSPLLAMPFVVRDLDFSEDGDSFEYQVRWLLGGDRLSSDRGVLALSARLRRDTVYAYLPETRTAISLSPLIVFGARKDEHESDVFLLSHRKKEREFIYKSPATGTRSALSGLVGTPTGLDGELLGFYEALEDELGPQGEDDDEADLPDRTLVMDLPKGTPMGESRRRQSRSEPETAVEGKKQSPG